ncbi:MAG: hypothetical protein J0I92_00690 [Phyllobacterium sp.]|nr:hypothetical protein [Phyllobacterium sp.]
MTKKASTVRSELLSAFRPAASKILAASVKCPASISSSARIWAVSSGNALGWILAEDASFGFTAATGAASDANVLSETGLSELLLHAVKSARIESERIRNLICEKFPSLKIAFESGQGVKRSEAVSIERKSQQPEKR